MAFTKIVGAGIQTTTDVTVRNVQAGIVTATKFIGDISEATGAAAGLGTALSQVQSSPLNKIYFTNQVLSIGSTITVDPPDSSNIAYTQYAEIAVEQGYDLIVEDGDDLVPDILGLSTVTATPLSGAGGRVRADQFTNKAGTGAPTFPNGVQVTGVSTLGNTIVGGGTTQLVVNGNARITGILTIGTSSITLDGSNNQVNVGTGVTINSSGVTVTGVVTATSFSGSGANLTGIAATTDVRTNSLVVSGITTVATLSATSLVGVNTLGVTTAYVAQLAGVGAGTSIQIPSGSKLVGLTTGSVHAPGTIVQVKNSTLTTEVTNATNSWASAGFNLTITPQSANNYFYVIFEGQMAKIASAAGGFGVQIYKNGASVTASTGDAGDRPYDIYKDETRIFTRMMRAYYAQTGSTSSTTFDVYFKRYDTFVGTIHMNYTSTTTSISTLTVMEIAG